MFTIEKTDGRARTGIVHTPHGSFKTPAFMPCGTKGAVKTLTPDELKTLGCEIILGNTYHLMIRPGEELIQKLGGLRKWSGWNGPILTDSGGFQVFSLGAIRRITDEGVEFRSHVDGTPYFLTPERSIDIQLKLGSDIIMAFDECAPADSDYEYAKCAMERTHTWLNRSIEQFNYSKTEGNMLFGIIQGVIFDDLRQTSTNFVAEKNLAGIAIGGLSVGESKSAMYHTLQIVSERVPQDKPLYLMGVGAPEDIVHAVLLGVDMFDCVLPIKNQKYTDDAEPLQKECACFSCLRFSKSYIRHLCMENEMLSHRLMTIHNLHFLLDFMRKIRQAIEKKSFEHFKANFLKSFKI